MYFDILKYTEARFMNLDLVFEDLVQPKSWVWHRVPRAPRTYFAV
jgi:hypothetical protein